MYKRRVRAEVRVLRSGAGPESGPLRGGAGRANFAVRLALGPGEHGGPLWYQAPSSGPAMMASARKGKNRGAHSLPIRPPLWRRAARKALYLLRVSRLRRIPHNDVVPVQHRPAAVQLSAGSRLQHPGARGQRLIAGPLLNAALKVFQRCRWCASCVPNDPYDLATAPTSAAANRSRARGSPALAVSTAALADHVCDRWHRRLAPRRRFPGWRKRNPAGSPTTDAIWIFPAEVDPLRAKTPVSCAANRTPEQGGHIRPGPR